MSILAYVLPRLIGAWLGWFTYTRWEGLPASNGVMQASLIAVFVLIFTAVMDAAFYIHSLIEFTRTRRAMDADKEQ